MQSFMPPMRYSVHLKILVFSIVYVALVNPAVPYPLSADMNGYCIIINNMQSSDHFKKDFRRLKTVFSDELHFHVESFTSLSSQAIDELLETLGTEIDHTQFKALVVIFYGEGDSKGIKGCGNEGESLEFANLESNFTYENCPTLSSKPKLFIFNLKQATTRQRSFIRRREQERYFPAFPESNTPDVFRIFSFLNEENTAETFDPKKRFAFIFTEAMRSTNADKLDSIAKDCSDSGLVQPTIRRTIILTSAGVDSRPDHDDFRRARLAAELKMAYPVWRIIRSKTIDQISDNKDKLSNLAKDARISRIAGASAGIVGGTVAVAGFIMLPFTFGGSIIVSGVGAGIAAVGGLTSIGATIAQRVIENGELKKVNNLISIDHQLSQIIHDLIEILQNEAKRLSTDNPGASKEAWLAGILRSADVILRVGGVGAKGAYFGVQAGVGALEGGAVVARLGVTTASMGFAVAGGALNVLLLPISIVELSVNIHHLAKNKNTKTTQVLEDLIKELHKSVDDAEQFINQGNTDNQQASVELFPVNHD